jgi:serine/threonine protein kinase
MHTPSQTGASGPPRQDPVGSSAVIPLVAADTDNSPTIITPIRPQPPSDASLGLTPGGRLGHFELLGSLGAGGMAAVLKARDTELGREVALKILPPHMAHDTENITRFKQEARAAARLDHDNIARVFFCGEDQGLHFIAFEFVEGENLRALIDRRGPLPPTECVRYLIQVAAGLAHASERGVVHRDIKPSNILITPDGKAKIVDMGLARNLHATVNGGVTQSGVTLGTFDYISPEQALDPRRADVRSDIYSLGCTFYHAVTGRPPVPEGTAAKKLHHHQNVPVLDPRDLNPAVTDELAAVLAKMMAKDPAQRYQTPAELITVAAVLARRINVGTDVFAALDPALVPVDPMSVQLLPQPPRMPVGLILGLGVVGVSALVALGLFNSSRQPVAVPSPPWGDDRPVGGRGPVPGPDLTAVTGSAATLPTTPLARTSEELVRFLRDDRVSEIQLLGGGIYDLSESSESAVILGRKRIEIGGPATNPPTIRVAAVAPDPGHLAGSRPGSLTIADCDLVSFRGIRFEVVDSRLPQEPVEHRPVAVLVSDVATLSLVECRFEIHRELQTADVAGLAVVRNAEVTSAPSTVAIRYCYFGIRRGSGVQLAGRIRAEAVESAFTPHHPAAFALRTDEAGSESSELTLKHCSFLMDRSSVVESEEAARWIVRAGSCVFAAGPPPEPGSASSMMMSDQPERRAAVLRVQSERAETTTSRFEALPGQGNAYYRTDPFAVAGRGYTFDDARAFNPPLAADQFAVELRHSPWALDPLTRLGDPEPRKGFQLRPTTLVRGVGEEVVLGLRYLTDAGRDGPKVYDVWPLSFQDEVVERGVKIWWPNPPTDRVSSLPRNVFTDLAAAIASAQSGDEIRIRHSGLLRVTPQQITGRPRLKLTIKPEDGSTPILTLADNELYEPSLFRLVDGEELVLEGLDIRLRARKPDSIRSQTAVTVVGGRRCVLRHCVVTLDPAEDETLAAVALADPGGGEMRTGDDRPPFVRMDRCLIRGKGRAVWVPAGRPFELDIENSMTALAGPVLEVDASNKQQSMGSVATVRLTRVTAALSGPVLDLGLRRAGTGRQNGWVPIEVRSERCLFTQIERGTALVLVDGGDPTSLRQSFTWTTGPVSNWYANFPATASFLEVIPPDDQMMTRTFTAEEWLVLTGERAESSIGKVAFVGGTSVLRKPLEVRAADMAIWSSPLGTAEDAGADVKQVAKPVDAPTSDR